MRDPDFTSDIGKLWRVTLRDPPPRPAWAATLGAWLLHSPFSHPWWTHYWIAVIHLRDIEGVPPASRIYPEATHELMIYALDPEKPVPEVDGSATELHFLTPPNLIYQFHGVSDGQAVEVVEKLARAFLNKNSLTPDSDFREANRVTMRELIKQVTQAPGGGLQ